MNAKEFLKQMIITTAEEYIEDHDLTNEHIILLDDFADALLYNLEILLERRNK